MKSIERITMEKSVWIVLFALLATACSLPDTKQDYRCHEKACKSSQDECECPPQAKVVVSMNGTILCQCPTEKEVHQ
jgi:hypothetical protein